MHTFLLKGVVFNEILSTMMMTMRMMMRMMMTIMMIMMMMMTTNMMMMMTTNIMMTTKMMMMKYLLKDVGFKKSWSMLVSRWGEAIVQVPVIGPKHHHQRQHHYSVFSIQDNYQHHFSASAPAYKSR